MPSNDIVVDPIRGAPTGSSKALHEIVGFLTIRSDLSSIMLAIHLRTRYLIIEFSTITYSPQAFVQFKCSVWFSCIA